MNIFAYGTLIVPEVMQRVAGKSFRAREGVLRGYARFRVKDGPEAAVIPFPDMQTDGVVYYDVDEESLRRLDSFEGPLFHRVEANVEAENGEWVEADIYVLRLRQRERLTAKPWDELQFREKDLERFLHAHPAATGGKASAG